MAIPSKVTTNNQVQDGFRKLNETIDNIVTGLTYVSSSSTLTIQKLDGSELTTQINGYGYSDYKFYAGISTTQEINYNYSTLLWKKDSFLHFGQGRHYLYIPTGVTIEKGYKLTLLKNVSSPFTFTVYLTDSGIDSEPSTALFTSGNNFHTTILWSGSYWVYYTNYFDSSYTTLKNT